MALHLFPQHWDLLPVSARHGSLSIFAYICLAEHSKCYREGHLLESVNTQAFSVTVRDICLGPDTLDVTFWACFWQKTQVLSDCRQAKAVSSTSAASFPIYLPPLVSSSRYLFTILLIFSVSSIDLVTIFY